MSVFLIEPIPIGNGNTIRALSMNDLETDNYLKLLEQLTVVGEISKETRRKTLQKMMECNKVQLTYVILVVENQNLVENLNPIENQNLNQIENKSATNLVAKLVGAATLLIEQKFIHECQCVGHIEDVVVAFDARKQGIGKCLIETLNEIAKENRCYKVILDCNNDNVVFYETCGFTNQENHMVHRLHFL